MPKPPRTTVVGGLAAPRVVVTPGDQAKEKRGARLKWLLMLLCVS